MNREMHLKNNLVKVIKRARYLIIKISWPGKRPAPVFAFVAAKKLGRLNIS
jgi:hypothetical protein